MKSFTIINPYAGKSSSGPSLYTIDQVLHESGIENEFVFTHKPGDATRFASEAASNGYDIVIAAGGDGSINEVVNGLAEKGITLGIIPVGTANVLSRELNIPLDAEKAAKIIGNGNIKKIDLGYANGRYFTLMAGIGFDAQVVHSVIHPLKDVIGGAAYVLKGLELLTHFEAAQITLTMPEQTYIGNAFLVIVANASTYAYQVKVVPDAIYDDGLIDICIFEKPISDKIGFARHLADIFLNMHLYKDYVKFFRTTSARLESEREIPVQLDGDPFSTTPIDISIKPGALPVFVP
jgi:diacylglycerol kinase (ATP)